jgi:hypothetical protein
MEIIVNCPHCDNIVFILKNEINCNIFRHGVIKTTMKQMDPHSPKDLCDAFFNNGEIYGCGKPFKLELTSISDISNDKTQYSAVTCDYI